jgi:hypothetical protein
MEFEESGVECKWNIWYSWAWNKKNVVVPYISKIYSDIIKKMIFDLFW